MSRNYDILQSGLAEQYRTTSYLKTAVKAKTHSSTFFQCGNFLMNYSKEISYAHPPPFLLSKLS